MARKYVVAAVMVLSRQLVIEAESDEQLQAILVERLQGDGVNNWNRNAFEQQAVNVTIAEVEVKEKDAVALPMLPTQLQYLQQQQAC